MLEGFNDVDVGGEFSGLVGEGNDGIRPGVICGRVEEATSAVRDIGRMALLHRNLLRWYACCVGYSRGCTGR